MKLRLKIRNNSMKTIATTTPVAKSDSSDANDPFQAEWADLKRKLFFRCISVLALGLVAHGVMFFDFSIEDMIPGRFAETAVTIKSEAMASIDKVFSKLIDTENSKSIAIFETHKDLPAVGIRLLEQNAQFSALRLKSGTLLEVPTARTLVETEARENFDLKCLYQHQGPWLLKKLGMKPDHLNNLTKNIFKNEYWQEKNTSQDSEWKQSLRLAYHSPKTILVRIMRIPDDSANGDGNTANLNEGDFALLPLKLMMRPEIITHLGTENSAGDSSPYDALVENTHRSSSDATDGTESADIITEETSQWFSSLTAQISAQLFDSWTSANDLVAKNSKSIDLFLTNWAGPLNAEPAAEAPIEANNAESTLAKNKPTLAKVKYLNYTSGFRKAAATKVRLKKKVRDQIADYEESPQISKMLTYAHKKIKPRKVPHCYRAVKLALLNAGLIDRYPTGRKADDAIEALKNLKEFGFVNLMKQEPKVFKTIQDAPHGAVLVYKGGPHGHVEIYDRIHDTGVSDFVRTKVLKTRKLVGILIKKTDKSPESQPLSKAEKVKLASNR